MTPHVLYLACSVLVVCRWRNGEWEKPIRPHSFYVQGGGLDDQVESGLRDLDCVLFSTRCTLMPTATHAILCNTSQSRQSSWDHMGFIVHISGRAHVVEQRELGRVVVTRFKQRIMESKEPQVSVLPLGMSEERRKEVAAHLEHAIHTLKDLPDDVKSSPSLFTQLGRVYAAPMALPRVQVGSAKPEEAAVKKESRLDMSASYDPNALNASAALVAAVYQSAGVMDSTVSAADCMPQHFFNTGLWSRIHRGKSRLSLGSVKKSETLPLAAGVHLKDEYIVRSM